MSNIGPGADDARETSSDDYDPQDDFGADGAKSSRNDDGGFHHTIWSTDGDRFSWDTDSDGNYEDGSAHHSRQ